VSSVGSFFSYVNDARSHEPEVCNNTICPPEDEQVTARNILMIIM